MKILITQEVGAPGAREEPKPLARLEFESDDEFPDSRFADDDNVQLLDGGIIKLTAVYRTNNGGWSLKSYITVISIPALFVPSKL